MSIIPGMANATYREIRTSLTQLYLDDPRPWLVGFSGGKDSTLLTSLIFDAVLSVAAGERKKPVTVLCTDTRVEIPAMAEMVEGTLAKMRKFSQQNDLNIEAHLLDFDGDLYGQEVKLKFVARLRDELKFASVDELIKQIHTDIARTREILE